MIGEFNIQRVAAYLLAFRASNVEPLTKD